MIHAYKITNLHENTEYGFQVRAQSANGGWGDFSPPIYRSPNKVNSPDDAVSIGEKTDASEGAQVRVAVGVIGMVIYA